jgi:hypothetical protein
LVTIQATGLVYELVVGGHWLEPSAWLEYGGTQVLQFLPGQLALLTTLAFLVALGRKFSAWWNDRLARRQEEPLAPLLLYDAYGSELESPSH